MATHKSQQYWDGGPDLLRAQAATTNRLQVHVLAAYTAGDSYSTVLGNSLGSASLVPGDITTADGSGGDAGKRVTTVASKAVTLTGSASGTPDLHLAILDTVGLVVHLATPDGTNPASVSSGGTVTTGAMVDKVGPLSLG